MGMTEPAKILHLNPAVHVAKLTYDGYKAMGIKLAVPFGQMIGNWRKKFEYPDEVTGELYIEYPDDGVFKTELAGFFNDPYAREAGFPFSLFYKSYGNYSGKAPRRFAPKAKLTEWETCDDCYQDYVKGTNHQCGVTT